MTLLKKEELLKLQNGSDIRGVASEGIEGQHVNLTNEAVNVISQSFVHWLSNHLKKPVNELKIGVGHDPRISQKSLKQSVLMAIISNGARAFDCGLASTPSMFMSIVFKETCFDGSIMITASHLPFNRNGLKFFTKDGGLEKEDITLILKSAADFNEKSADISLALSVDIISIYSESLRKKIKDGVFETDSGDKGAYEHPLSGLKIVVDAGNGAGGFFADKVLKPLGANIDGSQFLEPDGLFPNHIPNPEDKVAMDSVKTATVKNHADLGIIFDTDVDRMSAVLESGKEINRDFLIAMMGAILAKDYPGTTIVTDSVTSDNLTDFLENTLKLRHHRFRRGYKNVIDEAIRLNKEGIDTALAIETSGHGAMRENYFLDDGAYMAVKLLIALANAKKEAKNIGSLIEAYKEPFEAREYRMGIMTDDFKSYAENVLKEFEVRAKNEGIKIAPNSYEGVRLSFTDEEVKGWLLLRISLHEPLMPMNLEGKRPGDLEKILKIAKKLLAGFNRLDTSCLN